MLQTHLSFPWEEQWGLDVMLHHVRDTGEGWSTISKHKTAIWHDDHFNVQDATAASVEQKE